MTLEEAKTIINDWLTSNERIDNKWRYILKLCLTLIDEKIKDNNNGE